MTDGATTDRPAERRHVTPAKLLNRFGIERKGLLKLDGGRLSFVTNQDGTTVFDLPVTEMHSPMASHDGIHVWHGSTAYKFRIAPSDRQRGYRDYPAAASGDALGVAFQAIDFIAGSGERQQAKRRSTGWVAILEPLVGDPPADVKVRKPWSLFKSIAAIFAGAIVATAALVGILAGLAAL